MNGVAARRGRCQGVLQILRFNRQFYLMTISGVSVAFVVAVRVLPVARALLLAGCSLALFWTCSSLLTAYYVYDRFPLYELSWFARLLRETPRKWANIHSGLDETSHLLYAMFPSVEGWVLDIYDAQEMTEHSIKEARRMHSSPVEAIPARWTSLPLGSETIDAVLLMFAAHELRHHEARVQLFREVARVLNKDGEVALVEHTRNWVNFLAFGPGFLHFFSSRAWRQAARAARLRVRTEISLTPFVRVFMLSKTI
jgi:SAM-dependent methyltransferase